MQKTKRVKSKKVTEKMKASIIKANIIKSKIHKAKMPHDWHEIHLCYLANVGYQQQNSDEYKSLVRQPKFMCKHCGRTAAEKINLCQAVRL
jgi:hypothetical protein